MSYSHSHKGAACQHLKVFPCSNIFFKIRFFKSPLTQRGFFNKIVFEERIKLGFC